MKMGILINKNTKVIIQGITGREGSVRTQYMKEYGTKVIGGTSPGKAGELVHGIPVFNTVKEIVREQGEIDFSVVFVPVSYTHLRAHETDSYLVCRLLLEKKKKN